MSGKKPAPAKFEGLTEEADAEGWEEAVIHTNGKEEPKPGTRLRDWRDVERYREIRELRKQVDDEYGLEEVFELPAPVKPATHVKAAPKPKAKPTPKAPAKASHKDKAKVRRR